MKRPYIVCHMVASIDGRIDCSMVDKISITRLLINSTARPNLKAVSQWNITMHVKSRL